jgi:hypothetical protein
MADQPEEHSALSLRERAEICRKLAAEADEEARRADVVRAAFQGLAERCRETARELERRQRSALGRQDQPARKNV